jgi:ubiquinone/menaquinone biosynthesis C-methylase UbiE
MFISAVPARPHLSRAEEVTMKQSSRKDVCTAGDLYELYVGCGSQRADRRFLDWLTVPAGTDWLEVGCGTGAG